MTNLPPRAPVQMPSLDLPADLEIEYVNLVRIAHSISELVLDFARILPGSHPAQITSRIVMTPFSAKLFYKALGENLAKYETTFGEIKVPGDSSLANQLFRPANPPNPPSPPNPE